MRELRSMVHIVSCGAAAINWALQQGNRDFEDSVQYYAAMQCGAEYIITRNERDYPYTDIPACFPAKFLDLMNVV